MGNNKMQEVGFICDTRESDSVMKVVGASRQMRAIPLDLELKKRGINLLIYSWHHLNPRTKLISGYRIIDKEFVPVVSEIPKVNGNWYLGNYKSTNITGMTYRKFMSWANDNNIEIYPPYGFDRIVSDKYASYELAAKFSDDIHPYTELYSNQAQQIEKFLSLAKAVFIKPKHGSQGDKIAIVRKLQDGYELLYYEHRKKHRFELKTLDNIASKVKELIANKKYIIQSGIDVVRHENSSFIIRVIMLHDGTQWHWMNKLVLSPAEGDIANTEQDGMNYMTETIFKKIYGSRYVTMMKKLKNTSFKLAQYFDTLYPLELIEVALDFIVDKNENIYISEVDVTPGLIKPGMDVETPFQDIFNISQQEQAVYKKYVIPQAEYMAEFLCSKL